MNQSISQIISFIRFPLAILIVYSHFYTPDIWAKNILADGGTGIYAFIGEFTNHMPMVAAVPLFFFMSGYLYFAGTTDRGFNFQTWKKKSWNRVKSLVIPYIAWNLLILALYAGIQYMSGNSPTMQKEGYKLIADYQFIDYLKSLWAFDHSGAPMDGPLWFVRNLIVFSIVLSFPLYYCLRFTGVLTLIVLFIGGIYGLEFANISFTTIFFFAWGAFFAIKDFDLFTNVSERTSRLFGLAILSSLILKIIFCILHSPIEHYFNSLYIYTTITLIFGFLAPYIKKGVLKPSPFLASASFFIYAMHKPLQVIFRRYSFAILHPQSELLLCVLNLLIPAIVIALCLLTFHIVQRYLTRLKFLNGFRR
ncbi:MAG: acyltransferase [Fibrobacter sp.]|uniref:acyltransferase family protein n=1 Tax=Fibrobacter sp. TaxID=35828 RepID=UPI0025C39CAC|nr:acyltransferase [Fibrobacter sp.]MBQ7081685.1 acyltransferase [Fibrobacter sp.]